MAKATPRWVTVPEWLDLVVEDVLEPDRRIIDSHHHLSGRADRGHYLLNDLWADTGSGHRVEKTVFAECGESYRQTGPEHLRCVGETEFAAQCAAESEKGGPGKAVIAGIVAHADLTLGDAVREVLLAHEDVGRGLFRGIRHGGACDPYPDALVSPGRAPEGLYSHEDFRRGMRVVGQLGLSHDSWHFHHQLPEFTDLARAVPETTMVLDHLGTPLGVGPYSKQREEIYAQWQKDILDLAACPNVVAKLGGFALIDNGFGWEQREAPPTSNDLVDAQKRYYMHMIEAFGPERCMFESNFPVDKRSVSYRVLWNAFKKMVADFTEGERHALFYGTAARVYRL